MTEINIMMESFVSHAYSDLRAELILFSVACVILYFAAPLIIVRLMSRHSKKSYFFKDTTDKILHYIFLAVLVVDGIRAVFANTTVLVPHGKL